MILSHENRLMQLCARVTMDEKRQDEARAILKNNLDWSYIIRRAPEEGIAPLLFFNLKRFEDNGCIPFEVKQVLEREYLKTSFRNVIFLKELDKVLRAFGEANISAIVLKGGFLVENVYQDLALRPMSDVDLLVKKEDLINIYHNLNRLGYDSSFSLKGIDDFQNSPFSNYLNSMVYTKKENIRLCLNLHWHLANSMFPLYIYTNIDMKKIWQEARPFTTCCNGAHSNGGTNPESLSLAPHHLLIHLSEHAFRHCFNRLIWLVDIAEVLRVYGNEIDWKSFIKDSFDFNVSKPIFYSLSLAFNKLGAKIPLDILATLSSQKKGYGERIFLACVLKNKRFEELSCLLVLSMCKDLGQRMGFLWRLLFPPGQVLAQAYLKQRDQINFLDYLLRVFRGIGYIVRGLKTNE